MTVKKIGTTAEPGTVAGTIFPAGPPGLFGATGLQGATGQTGGPGPVGPGGGASGPPGATGVSITGATGLQGVQGATGVSITGATGMQGGQGSTGVQGIPGPGYYATSATSLAIVNSGAQSFTTQAGLAYVAGARARAISTGTGAWMEGVVTSYVGTTLVVTMDSSSGSGTHTDWIINAAAGQSGPQGASGLQGSTGVPGATGVSHYYVGTTAPPTPVVGDHWFSTSDGIEYGYIDDGTSVQWVEVGPGNLGQAGATGLQGGQGATGLQGLQGATGSPAGATGSTGVSITGATGLQGGQGATGLVGATGLSESYTPQTYGTVTLDGVTNMAALIQAAIDAAAAAGGGTVYLSPGNWGVSGGVNLKAGVQLRGAGKQATTIKTNSATADVLSINNASYGGIFDLSIASNVARTAGDYITFWGGCTDWVVRDIQMNGPFCGVNFNSCANIWLDEIQIINIVATGCGVFVNGGNDQYIRGVFAKGVDISHPCNIGIWIRQTAGLWLSGCSVLFATNGLQIDPQSGQVAEQIFSTMNGYDECSANGILIEPAAGGAVRKCKFVQDWSCTDQAHGTAIVASGVVDDVAFLAHRSLNNQFHGFYINGGANISVEASAIEGNGGAGTTYSGIYVEANTCDFAVINNRSGAAGGFSAVQKYGLCIAAGASTRYRIIGNDFNGNITAGMLDGGTGLSKQIIANLPLDPLTLTAGSTLDIAMSAGMLLAVDDSTGSSAIFVVGGGAVTLLGQSSGTKWIASSSPSSSQIGVFYNAGTARYRVKNGTSGTVTFFLQPITARPTV